LKIDNKDCSNALSVACFLLSEHTEECPYSDVCEDIEQKEVERICDCENCTGSLASCWRKYLSSKYGDFYLFPECKKYKSMEDQVEHIANELEEVCDSFLEADARGVVIEILDVIHACETLLRNMVSNEELEEFVEEVIKKNEERGYYED